MLFLAGGPAISIPFAIVTAWPVIGGLSVRIGLGRLPEETDAPVALRALMLPAIELLEPSPQPSTA
jgi:hypothetical protein